MIGFKRKLRKTKIFIAQAFSLFKEKQKYNSLLKIVFFNNKRFPSVIKYPILNEQYMSPNIDHYFYHPAWASRVLLEIKPEKHIDISSTINFVSHIYAFIPTEYYEY